MKGGEKLNSVHCMRLIAAVAVVLHHVTTGLGQKTVMFGAAGVDVFFVISGIVIGLSLINQEPPSTFAMRRLIRVVPPYWIATFVFMLFQYWVWGTNFSPERIARSLFFWPKFGPDWQLIYFPAWTLCYEMLFYVASCMALIVARRHALIICLCVITLVGLFRIPVPGSTSGAFFSTAVSLEFCIGLLLAATIRSGWRPSRITGVVMLAIAAAMFWRYQSAVLLISENADIPRLTRPLGLGIPSALLICGTLAFETAAVFRSYVATLGGNASYAIYLCHIIVINIISDRLARHGIRVEDHFWVSAALLSIASIAIGICAHLTIEKPVLRFLQQMFLHRRHIDKTAIAS